MPCTHWYFGDELTAPQVLEQKPVEFTIEEYGWKCKLGFKGRFGHGIYLLWVDDVPVTSLP